jgi:hypothetical protein
VSSIIALQAVLHMMPYSSSAVECFKHRFVDAKKRKELVSGPQQTISWKYENLVTDQVNQAIAEQKNVKVEVFFLPPEQGVKANITK